MPCKRNISYLFYKRSFGDEIPQKFRFMGLVIRSCSRSRLGLAWRYQLQYNLNMVEFTHHVYLSMTGCSSLIFFPLTSFLNPLSRPLSFHIQEEKYMSLLIILVVVSNAFPDKIKVPISTTNTSLFADDLDATISIYAARRSHNLQCNSYKLGCDREV